MSSFACRHASVVALGVALALAAPARAQDDDPGHLLEEFIHYTLIAKPDLAAGYAQALLSSPITDAELAELLDDGRTSEKRFDAALGRAHAVPQLEEIAAELDRRVSDGRLDLARDPQRIDEAIAMLVGTRRQQLHARQLLEASGEFAVPRLLRVVVEGKDERLRSACGDMLVLIGRQAVIPLCAALPNLDGRNQRFVCRVLAEIRLPAAAPFLMALAMNERAAASTREAALRAFGEVGGMGEDLSVLHYELARQYFDESDSLIAFPYEPTNIVWSYDPFHGLEATPVATGIFSEIMAMKMAATALEIDPGNEPALSLFVAANLRRDNQMTAGIDDPIYGENRYSPEFYATVFGTPTCLEVLGLAIDRFDTALVRDAIAALSETTGGANLFSGSSGRQPLLEALEYPDRRVQYEAALTLGRALPLQRFPADVTVVPLLASAVRTGDAAFAVVIAADEEDRRVLSSRLDALGFSIVAAGSGLESIESVVSGAIGVDLVVAQPMSAEAAILLVDDLHILPKTAAAPVLLIAEAVDMPAMKDAFRDNLRVKVSRSRVDDAAFADSVDEVMLRAAGGRMTEAESEAYAIDAIMVLRDIAIAGPTAYAVIDAEPALLQALEGRHGGTRLAVADILALIDSAVAQRALFDAALAAGGDEQIELFDRVAESVKRYGDRTEPRHVQALLDLVANSGGPTAEAAARVYGALALPPSTALELIP